MGIFPCSCPLNIVPPICHGVGMMKRRSVVATFAIYIGTTAGAAQSHDNGAAQPLVPSGT